VCGPEFGRVSEVVEVSASPASSVIAFTGKVLTGLDTAPTYRLCLVDAAGGTPDEIDTGPNDALHPKWSPDGAQLAFLSDRSQKGRQQLFLLSADRLAEPISTPEIEGTIEYIAWSPDGGSILMGVAESGADLSSTVGSGKTAIGQDERPSWAPSIRQSLQPEGWRRAWAYDLATRRSRSVSSVELNVWEAAWCGPHQLAAIVSDGPSEDTWYTARLGVLDVGTGQERVLMRSEVQLGLPSASPNGRHMAVVEAVCSDRLLVAGDVFSVDPSTGVVERVDTAGVDVTFLQWRDDDHLLFAGIRGLQTCVGEREMSSGKVSEIWVTDETCGAIYPEIASTDPTGFALLFHSQARPPEVAVVRDGQVRTVFSIDAQLGGSAQREPAGARALRWKAPDGLEIEGLLTLPEGSGPHPVVVVVHGGPVWAHLNRWEGIGLSTLLVERGCAVFSPNPRGSSGRGQGFAAMVYGDPGGADAEDIMAGIDMLVESGIADPDRIGVGGLSYGGFMSCWLVTQSDRFAAAVAESPGTDWLSGHFTSNIATWVRRILADEPDRLEGRYFTRNCVLAAPRARTPVLLIAGSEDACAPPGQAIEFFQALEENGVEAQLALYPEEGHGVQQMPAKIDYLSRSVEWFSRHLRLAPLPPPVR